jgi:hypothetical protein
MDDSFFLSFSYLFFLEEWKVDLAGFCLLSFSTTAYWAWRVRGHPGKTKNSDINGKRNLKPRGFIALDIGGVFCFSLFFLLSSFFLIHQKRGGTFASIQHVSYSGFVGSFNCCSVLAFEIFLFVAMYAGHCRLVLLVF